MHAMDLLSPMEHAVRLQKALFPLFVALGTKAMDWLAVCHRRLQCAGEGSTSMVGQFVPLLLCRPCFELHQLVFQLTYLTQQVLLRRVGQECAMLGGNDLSGEFDNLRLDGSSLLDAEQRLSEFARRLQRRDDVGNISKAHSGKCVLDLEQAQDVRATTTGRQS